MRILFGMVVLFAGAAVCTAGADKIDPAKLVGKWAEKDAKNDQSMSIEFTKDGKFTIVHMGGGKDFKTEGTYKLDSEKLKLDSDDLKMTIIIKKLTDDEFVGGPEGKKDEKTFTRIKPKK